jgi:hypothetical protein
MPRAHIVPHLHTVTAAVITLASVRRWRKKLLDAITPRYRALVLLATFASLRWTKLAAFRRRAGHAVAPA